MTGELIGIVDAAMAEAVRRSGAWLACRPGCFECCLGAFPITQTDAQRLREGLAALAATDPPRAARVGQRAREAVVRLCRQFPGDPLAVLAMLDDESAEDNQPCPALDPATGTCDLYEARPVTCRTFGPAVSCGGEALGVCELCYQGASDEEIAACRVDLDAEAMEDAGSETIVAFALSGSIPARSPAST
jgi:Fe-S-cluster containining protein